MSKLFKNLFSKHKENQVHFKWWEYFLYGLLPGGELFMRMFKLNGSMDKAYMLFPLFFFPPFSFIPLLMARFGLFKKGTGGNPIDWFMIIPIITKFLSYFLFNNFSIVKRTIFTVSIVLFSVLLSNILHFLHRDDCKENKNMSHITFRTLIDSCIEYGLGTATVSLTKFIPVVGEFIMIGERLPLIGTVFKEILWSIGYGLAYVLNNMWSNIESNICTSSPSTFRIVLGVVLIVYAFFNEGFHNLF